MKPKPKPKPIDNGGPAFPLACSFPRSDGGAHRPIEWGDLNEGMTLRDYFAAHAPWSPRWDFNPSMPPPPKPTYGKDEFGETIVLNAREVAEWDREHDRQASIQWPWIWADAMIEARKAK